MTVPSRIPGPSPSPRVGGMVPVLGQRYVSGIDLEPEQTDQKILCVICVSESVFEPPAQVVIADGSSLCVPHFRGKIAP